MQSRAIPVLSRSTWGNSVLQVEQLNQYYGESHTLWDIDLKVTAGQCTCIMGRNGVGKTTFLKCVMGLVKISKGRILLHQEDLVPTPSELRARRGIGYVPQGREIFPRLTVEENLRLGLLAGRYRGHGTPDDDATLERIYGLFPVLKQMLQRRGGDLSGGQQQQLAIGRALALRPQLLILDEPGEGIQPNIVHQIGDVLIQLREEGMTVLLVEQKLPFARRVAQNFVIFDRGRSVATGPMEELTDDLVTQHLVV